MTKTHGLLHFGPMKKSDVTICSTMQMLLDKFEYTLPETNIAPERGWLEDKFPLRWHIFRGEMWVSGSVCILSCKTVPWFGFGWKR